MAQPSKKDLKILQDFAATTIQSFWRMILGKQYIRWHATQYYEKLIDTKRNAYYYYNHLTGEASWLKPSFMGTEDFEVQENYDFYQSDVYKFASYKINKYNLTTYDNNNRDKKGDGIDDDDDFDDDADYKIYKIDVECIDYNLAKEQDEDETDIQRLLRVEREQKQQEEEEKKEELRLMKEEAEKALEKEKKSIPLYVKYDFQQDFGAPLYHYEHHIYDPPLKSNDFTVLA